MKRTSIPFSFPNGRGEQLAGILDLPAEAPLFFGVFAPCFTCVKESHGAAKICREMAEHGAAMLRFDITGIGGSQGSFAEQNFSNRIQDIIAACHALSVEYEPPKLLVGHSISGTAAIHAVPKLPPLQAVATVGSPRSPAYVIEKFRSQNRITERNDGLIDIDVLGQPVAFKPSFIDDMMQHDTEADIAKISKKLFVFHAPHDDIVSYANAEALFSAANDNPANDAELVRLSDDATHLFEARKEDAVFVAETLLDWFRTHLR
ncbi:MAG: alpha/beta hydrolase [Alphaproteobacteria bacterium]|nr:alpha/beta hydrolase [Alphaproteobacteria bacterium]